MKERVEYINLVKQPYGAYRSVIKKLHYLLEAIILCPFILKPLIQPLSQQWFLFVITTPICLVNTNARTALVVYLIDFDTSVVYLLTR